MNLQKGVKRTLAGTNSQKFRYSSAYTPKAGIQTVKFGYDEPLLEVELNELQQIQNEQRASLARNLFPSGFIELVSKNFSGEPIIYQPNDSLTDLLNCIAIAPSKVIVNGMEIILSGNSSFNGYNDYILLNLGKAPATGTREDLVYLEVWEESLSYEDAINKYGYINGNVIDNYSMLDSRVQAETSMRTILRWDIKVAKNINFETFPSGLGYANSYNFSNVQATVDGTLGFEYNQYLIYCSATDSIFKDEPFYGDYNLYVAGRPDYTIASPTIVSKYIFAIPMFRVKRRNREDYSLDNFNGSRSKKFSYIDFKSVTNGDLKSNIRPDKLFYDSFDERDIIDIRRTVITNSFVPQYYLNKGIKELFTGTLQTKDKRQTRRIQFGRSRYDYSSNEDVVLVVSFDDKTCNPIIDAAGNNTINPIILTDESIFLINDIDLLWEEYWDYTDNLYNLYNLDNTTVLIGDKDIILQTYGRAQFYKKYLTLEYSKSISGYGLLLNGITSIKYSIPDVKNSEGTIDFFLEPFWDGIDDCSQTLFIVLDSNDNVFCSLRKENKTLIYKIYEDVKLVKTIIVDLTDHLIFKEQIYHIRCSWTNNAKINRALIYINGNVVGQEVYNGSKLNPASLLIGQEETINCKCIIEDVVVYKVAYEQSLNNGIYVYIGNTYWPSLPSDFIEDKACIYPSFNRFLMNFSDDEILQKDTVLYVDDRYIRNKFILNTEENYVIPNQPKVYAENGETDSFGKVIELTGQWEVNEERTKWEFTPYQSVNAVVFQYDVIIPNGNGGIDLPDKILGAGFVNTNDILQEASYARTDTNVYREVSFVNPTTVSAATDKLFDFPVSNRGKQDCFTRIAYYHMSGNGTNVYQIPSSIYGYNVFAIVNCTNRKITRSEFVLDSAKENIDYFEIELSQIVAYGDVIELKVILGGTTFDYETQTKTLVKNFSIVKTVGFTADGLTNSWIVPIYNQETGGVLKSVLTFEDNIYDNTNTEIIGKNNYYTCYTDCKLFPYRPLMTDSGEISNIYAYQLNKINIDESSWGTPFLRFSMEYTPAAGTIIQIPILTTYQPRSTEVLSIWYEHIPYQGILNKTHKKLRRISDWKYFITTLGSGNLTLSIDEENINSYNTIINRLPGGGTYASLITGDNIQLTTNPTIKEDIQSQLQFINEILYSNNGTKFDDIFFELDTDFEVFRITSGYQDEPVQGTYKPFKIYYPDSTESIKDYTGMASLVIDEEGQIMLLVFGCLNKESSTENMIQPIYGDLFRLTTLPTTVPLIN